MWVARYFFVGCFAALVLAAMQIWAMAETIERAELRLMPMTTLPVKAVHERTANKWAPPCERMAAAMDEIQRDYGDDYLRAVLRREMVRLGMIKFTDEG